MREAYICDAIRTPVGAYGGGLSSVRADDLAAIPLKVLVERNPHVDWDAVDDVILGCANQAGEDNRNVARMSLLLAGYPLHIPGVTVNRLCSSGLHSIGSAARAIKAGEGDLFIAGGVESMSRSPVVMAKATQAFSRAVEAYDTTIGWRFVNKKLDEMYGTDSMIQTADNVAREYKISREDQDVFALWSQEKAAAAQANGNLREELVPVTVPRRKKDPLVVDRDEHPRSTSLEKLARLRPIFGGDNTVTAGNASGINDGAGAVIVASEEAVKAHGLTPLARILGMDAAGVPPRVMGLGPVPATQKLLKRLRMSLDDMDIIELNEAFAAQSLACTRQLGLEDNDPRLNPCGGAIALGHPLGMSGTRLVITALYQLSRSNSASKALCSMCVGVGQGMSMVIEKV